MRNIKFSMVAHIYGKQKNNFVISHICRFSQDGLKVYQLRPLTPVQSNNCFAD